MGDRKTFKIRPESSQTPSSTRQRVSQKNLPAHAVRSFVLTRRQIFFPYEYSRFPLPSLPIPITVSELMTIPLPSHDSLVNPPLDNRDGFSWSGSCSLFRVPCSRLFPLSLRIYVYIYISLLHKSNTFWEKAFVRICIRAGRAL